MLEVGRQAACQTRRDEMAADGADRKRDVPANALTPSQLRYGQLEDTAGRSELESCRVPVVA